MDVLGTKSKDEVIAALRDQVNALRALLTIEQERVNRLTEALAQRSGIGLVLPIAPRPAEPAPEPLVPAAKADAWWKANVSGHSIATPPREEKVSAPQS